MGIRTKINETFGTFAQRIVAAAVAPRQVQSCTPLLIVAVSLLVSGFCGDAFAQVESLAAINYNDDRIVNTYDANLTYFEGSFGALIMAAAGIGAILAAMLNRYKLALFLLGLAVGAFFTRSLIATYFNDANVIS